MSGVPTNRGGGETERKLESLGGTGDGDFPGLEMGSCSGSVCRAVNPDSKDCISRRCRGVGKYSCEYAGFLEGESNITEGPNGCTMIAGVGGYSNEVVDTSPGKLCVEKLGDVG